MDPVSTYGAISLIPCAVIIVLALITKKTFEPLLISTVVAFAIYAKEDFFEEFVNGALTVMGDPTIGWVILVCGLMGALMLILEKSNAALSFATLLSKFANTKKKSMFATWALGICLFIDDYLNILTVGNTMKRVTDKFGISRSMLSYSVGSTAAPICVLAPVSTWAIFFASLLVAAEVIPEGQTGFTVYLHCVPFIFYSWLTVFIITPLVILGVIPKVGALKRNEQRAQETGNLFPEEVIPPQVEAVEENEEKPKAGIWDFILPIVILVTVSVLVGNDVLKGIMVALFATALIYSIRKIMNLTEFISNFWGGFESMVQVLGLLVMAFMFKNGCSMLGLTDYVIATVKPLMSGGALPAIVFVVTGLMAFAMANFWGLAAIVVPIVIPLSQAMGVDLYLVSAAVFSGAAFGSHACFYADSAILIGKSTDIRPYDYAITQLPYAILAAVGSTILYLIFGFMM